MQILIKVKIYSVSIFFKKAENAQNSFLFYISDIYDNIKHKYKNGIT